MNNIQTEHSTYGLFTVAVGVCIAALLLDISFPLGVAGGMANVAAILIGLWFPNRRQVFYITLMAGALVIAGYFLSPPGGVFWVVVINRVLSFCVVMATGFVVYLASSRRQDSGSGDVAETQSGSTGVFGIFGSSTVVLGLAALLSILGISFYVNNESDKSQQWVSHTREVKTHIGHVLSMLQDMETGQRGYLLTGDDKYLEPFNSAIDGVAEEIQILADLTADNPNQQARIKTLLPLSDEKITELQNTIALRQTEGFDSALAVVKTDVGKVVMDLMRGVLYDMNAEEDLLLENREALSQELRSYTISAYGLAVFFIIGIALVIANRVRKYIVYRKMAENLKLLEETSKDRTRTIQLIMTTVNDIVNNLLTNMQFIQFKAEQGIVLDDEEIKLLDDNIKATAEQVKKIHELNEVIDRDLGQGIIGVKFDD